ncbi:MULTISPECIES: D-serine ammonia-lyase [Bacillus]|uniref:D-serine ammonia-lyase n=1 Tax=Bacillus TaxID=1386 RepID=UPI0003014A36|nr:MULTISPECIES: D-serine ammonia-lyase [Bacillus]
MEKLVQGKSIQQWVKEFPLLQSIIQADEVFWINDNSHNKQHQIINAKQMKDAEKRLERFASYIEQVFPETAISKGIIESPLKMIPTMKQCMEENYNCKMEGSLWMKCDHELPISGSIKARGGIYEVLKHAEDLAIEHGIFNGKLDYKILDSDSGRDFFKNFRIAVGSTGNLGLSIGLIGRKLGFHVTVHMSADAKQWKKDLLKSIGVDVIEYMSDYSKAVEEGRKQAAEDPLCYFIDDENSNNLFLGYAVAASRLKAQLNEMSLTIDDDHPLFVYLPCGVGGGPGGVTFGLKVEFGENVHCFFAEPTHSPCFLIGQLTRLQDQVSVQDFGLDNKTAADGLAVGRASSFVGNVIGHQISGHYTIEDKRLFSFLPQLVHSENIYVEPSALAGFYGPIQLFKQKAGEEYIHQKGLKEKMKNAIHIVWSTGGNMVPSEVMKEYYQKALQYPYDLEE